MIEIETGIFKIEDKKNIYVIGDIHGDYQVLIHCLVDLCKVAKISKIERDIEFDTERREIIEWIPDCQSIIVFCGDLIHRKRFDVVLDDECSDIYIISTILNLKESAKKNNGNVLIVSGNHEIMSILDPDDMVYTSPKNEEKNKEYFKNTQFIDRFINNSYAWLKINDIMITHGGLCSDYLRFLDQYNLFSKKIFMTGGSNILLKKYNSQKIFMIGGKQILFGNEIVKYINDMYRSFFTNGVYKKDNKRSSIEEEQIAYKLFVEYDMQNKSKHNMFWCREWGYNNVNCEGLSEILEKVDCEKMIVAHCPQFLSVPEQKMINFECLISGEESLEKYRLARVDLGMSRSFEYNKEDNKFLEYLKYNRNRKMSVLKLIYDESKHNYYFNYSSVITERISCLQYLLMKYGKTKEEWTSNQIKTEWLGFSRIELLLKVSETDVKEQIEQECQNNDILCLLYPLYFTTKPLKSISSYNKLK